MVEEIQWTSFLATLDETHQWPCLYLFKFIAPRDKAEEVVALFEEGTAMEVRFSSTGKYVSLTAEIEMDCGAEVVAVYRLVEGIEGVRAL